MVNDGRNNLKWFQKTNLSQVINNNGLSSKSVYRYCNRGNHSQQYKKGFSNVSCFGESLIGVHSTDGQSKYPSVRKIQRQQKN